MMRNRILIAALLTSVIAAPALAQDRGGRDRNEANVTRDVDRQQGRPQRAAPARQAPQAQQQRRAWQQRQAQAPQAQAAVDPRQHWNGGGWRGQAQTQQQVPAQARQRWQGGGWARGQAGVAVGESNPNARNWNGYGERNGRNFDRNNNGRVDPRFNRNGNGGWNGDNGGRWNRDWRNDRRYDWQRWRYSNRGLFSLPRYESPYGYGYGYQRFGIGVYLDSVFFGSNYWIDDPYQYRLPEAYPPYHWIRYYNDAMLVDEESGYVVDVIYDFFY